MYPITQLAPSSQYHCIGRPKYPRISERINNPRKVRVNLNTLLKAPSGQMYLHQNMLINKLPKKRQAIEITAIHAVSSPLNPVAIA